MAAAGRVLVVEDDTALREMLSRSLEASDLQVTAVGDGLAATRIIEGRDPGDIVLLDIGLPFVDGWRILERLPTQHRPGVIVISARGEERDKVRALDLGADDFLAKPFGADELLARVRAVLRRVSPPAEPRRVAEAGGVRVDLAARAVLSGDREVRLSPTEWVLLAELARNPGITLDHRTLLRRVWGPAYADERNYLRTFIQRLRMKLEADPQHPVAIVTVGRRGYRFGAAATEAQVVSTTR